MPEPKPAKPILLFFMSYSNNDGENLDLFVQAFDVKQAKALYSDYYGQPFGGRIFRLDTIRRCATTTCPQALAWGTDVIEEKTK